MHDDDTTYQIIRFHFDEDHPDHRKVIDTGLTLAEAQEHCRSDDTRGGSTADGSAWFDGYEQED